MSRQILVLTFAVNAVLFTIPRAHADTGGYPYWNKPSCADGKCTADPYGFYYRECTSFAAWKLNQLGIAFTNNMVGPNGSRGHFGSADNWANNSRAIGYTVNHTPAVNAIAQWNSGHVAVVSAVNGDGTIAIEEYNWGYTGNYGQRTISASVPSNYIHIADVSGGGSGSGDCSSVPNGYYCGGGVIAGDPNTLYECWGGTRYTVESCYYGCQVMPPGTTDRCRSWR